MRTAIVCERMGWTYEQYKDQPAHFIETLMMKWSLENEVANKKHGNR